MSSIVKKLIPGFAATFLLSAAYAGTAKADTGNGGSDSAFGTTGLTPGTALEIAHTPERINAYSIDYNGRTTGAYYFRMDKNGGLISAADTLPEGRVSMRVHGHKAAIVFYPNKKIGVQGIDDMGQALTHDLIEVRRDIQHQWGAGAVEPWTYDVRFKVLYPAVVVAPVNRAVTLAKPPVAKAPVAKPSGVKLAGHVVQANLPPLPTAVVALPQQQPVQKATTVVREPTPELPFATVTPSTPPVVRQPAPVSPSVTAANSEAFVGDLYTTMFPNGRDDNDTLNRAGFDAGIQAEIAFLQGKVVASSAATATQKDEIAEMRSKIVKISSLIKPLVQFKSAMTEVAGGLTSLVMQAGNQLNSFDGYLKNMIGHTGEAALVSLVCGLAAFVALKPRKPKIKKTALSDVQRAFEEVRTTVTQWQADNSEKNGLAISAALTNLRDSAYSDQADPDHIMDAALDLDAMNTAYRVNNRSKRVNNSRQVDLIDRGFIKNLKELSASRTDSKTAGISRRVLIPA